MRMMNRLRLRASRVAAMSVVVLCAAFTMPAEATGACYKARPLTGPTGEPITDRIEPVCKALADNLNEFCDEPPMVCHLKIHPKYAKTMALPEWKSVNLRGSLALVERFVRAPWEGLGDPRAPDRIWQEERAESRVALKEGRLRLSTSRLDLYQTGRSDQVYMLDRNGDCEQKLMPQFKSSDRTTWPEEFISPRRTVQYTPDALTSFKKEFWLFSHGGLNGELFIFEGKTFTYSIASGWPRRERWRPRPVITAVVFQGTNFLLNNRQTIDARPVCELIYQPE